MFDAITHSDLASSILDPSAQTSQIGDRVSGSDLSNLSAKSSTQAIDRPDSGAALDPLKATDYCPDSILSETYWHSLSEDSALQQCSGQDSLTDALTGTAQNTALVSNGAADSLTGSLSASSASASTAVSGNTRQVAGTLGSDTFAIDSRYQYNIFSGNGNFQFGKGEYDWIDLSAQSSKSVTFNFATTQGGGVLYDPGNGSRKFDSITLSNGSQILFENIDKIRFADDWMDLSVMPNDPQFSQQWNLHMMGVQNAWYFTTGSASVLVGIEDTGLGTDSSSNTHPDLRSTTIYPDNYQDDFSQDATSHGTDVQGVIAANSDNGVGMSGINWNSSVFSIDVLGSDGGSDQGDQSLVQATQNLVDFARSQGQRLVINMSLGGGSIDPGLEQLVAANQDSVLFVIASGNDDRNSLSNPASLAARYDNVVAVGASWGSQDTYGNPESAGTRISYSGGWGSNYGSGLTLMAPSEVIATSATSSYYGGTTFDYDSKFNGTSAAASNVTGVASLVWSANSNLSATQVKTILSQTAYDLGSPGYDLVYGNGFVNADAAVRRAIALA